MVRGIRCTLIQRNSVNSSRAATENGGSVVYGPMEAPEVGTFLGLADPVSSHFTVIQLAAPVD